MATTPFRFGTFPAITGSTPVSGASHAAIAGSATRARELSVLESSHPGVARTVTLLWGHPELNDFLARVAAGLDPRLAHMTPAAMAELMLLAEIHRTICPRQDPKVVEPHPISRLGGTWRPAVHRG